jgi:hypothetical protein
MARDGTNAGGILRGHRRGHLSADAVIAPQGVAVPNDQQFTR